MRESGFCPDLKLHISIRISINPFCRSPDPVVSKYAARVIDHDVFHGWLW